METGEEANEYYRKNTRGTRLVARDATIDEMENGKIFVTHSNLNNGCEWVDHFKGVFNFHVGGKVDIYYVWSYGRAYYLATSPHDTYLIGDTTHV